MNAEDATLAMDQPAAVAAVAVPSASGLRSWYALAVFVVATVLAAVDGQLIVLLTDPIKKSLSLSDTQIGLLGGIGLTLIAGLAAVPIGWLADRFDRRAVLVGSILVWSVAAGLCGMSSSFLWFFVAAVGLGVGKAGVRPIIWGLIPEVVTAQRRVLANNVYAFVTLLGTGLGVGLAGVLLQTLEGARDRLPQPLQDAPVWRLALFTVAAIGPLVALLVLGVRKHRIVLVKPGAVEAADSRSATIYIRAHVATMVGVFGTFGLAGVGVGSIQMWLPVAAGRNFGATPASIGQAMGLAIMIATLLGAGIGTLVVRWLLPRIGTATPLRLIGGGLVISALSAMALPLMQSATQLYVLFVVVATPLVTATILLPTLVQDIAPPQLRSRVTAVGIVIATLIAASSPVLVGALSDMLQPRPNGLMLAVAVISGVGMLAGAVLSRVSEAAFVNTVEGLRAALGTVPAKP